MKNLLAFAFINGPAFHRCRHVCKVTRLNFDHPIRTLCTTQIETVETVSEKKLVFKPNMKVFLKQFPSAGNLVDVVASNLNIDERTIMNFVHAAPEVATFHPSTVASNLRQLLDLGFRIENIHRIIQKYPHVLEYEKDQICETFESWRDAGLPEKFLWNLFTRSPLLFSISNNEVKYRVGRLFYFMEGRINRVLSVIELNPGIMHCNWKEVEDKFKYIYYEIRTTEKDISRSKALSLPLSHLKLRYSFLERCGIYRRATIKEKNDFNPADNPPLALVVDTDDNRFATDVAKVSLAEFEVFQKLMQYSFKNEDEDDDDPLEYSLEEGIDESDFDVK